MPTTDEFEKNRLLTISEYLLGGAALELCMLLVPAGIAAFLGKEVSIEPLVPLRFHPPDIVLIFMLLTILALFYLFYHWIYPYARESSVDHLVSLTLAVWLLLQNHLVFFAGALPYRGFMIAVPIFFAWYKNGRLCRRYAATPFEARIDDWHRKARWSSLWLLGASVPFMLLMDGNFRKTILGEAFEKSAPIGKYFDIVVPLIAYGVGFAISLRSLLRTRIYFREWGRRTAKLLEKR